MKKSSNQKHSRSAARRKKRPKTGLDPAWAFFLGGDSQMAGLMHYRTPRQIEYEQMKTSEIGRRIEGDLSELLARAYSNENVWHPFRHWVNAAVAESMGAGLQGRLGSHDDGERTKACSEYRRLVNELLATEAKEAADWVAFITKHTASYLENLFVKRSRLMMAVAAGCSLWPVNLGLKPRKFKAGSKLTLTRAEFARDYLTELALGSDCKALTSTHTGAEGKTSPFKLAADGLYQSMLMLKSFPAGRVAQKTSWTRQLLALPAPMTDRSKAKWWKVVKVYLYERWENNPEEFALLVNHFNLGLSNKLPYESSIKTRVIDNGLKEAFYSLAQLDL